MIAYFAVWRKLQGNHRELVLSIGAHPRSLPCFIASSSKQNVLQFVLLRPHRRFRLSFLFWCVIKLNQDGKCVAYEVRSSYIYYFCHCDFVCLFDLVVCEHIICLWIIQGLPCQPPTLVKVWHQWECRRAFPGVCGIENVCDHCLLACLAGWGGYWEVPRISSWEAPRKLLRTIDHIAHILKV